KLKKFDDKGAPFKPEDNEKGKFGDAKPKAPLAGQARREFEGRVEFEADLPAPGLLNSPDAKHSQSGRSTAGIRSATIIEEEGAIPSGASHGHPTGHSHRHTPAS